MKILIVDDNSDDRLLLKYNIEHHGNEVVEAVDGLDGIEKATLHKPDLIVSDAMMPRMDGFHFLKNLKENEVLSSIPFIFYSAMYIGDEETTLGLSQGAEAYIIKPREQDKLWTELDEIINNIQKGEKKSSRREINTDQKFLESYSSIVLSKLEVKLKELEAEIELRKQTEAALIESESKFRTLYESSSDAILIYDDSGFIDCNASTLKIFGCSSRDDFIHRHPSYFSPQNQPGGQNSLSLANEYISTAFQHGRHQFEWIHARLDGTIFPAEVLLTAMKLGGKSVLQATVRDITSRKQIEEQLLQSAKMATLGEIATGVAHEINQPLTVINIGIQLLVRAIKSGQLTNEFLLDQTGKFTRNIDRVFKIINHLRVFGRKVSVEKMPFNINVAIGNAVDMVDNRIDHSSIKMNLKLENKIPNVLGEESSLEQVFINILLNAIDALSTIKDDHKKEISILSNYDFSNQYVIVKINNNGPEIPNSIIQKIFDPFFTEKAAGHGTGLGLSISYGIMQSHGGSITVENTGNGPCFTIRLPVESRGK